jgi:hypothetical protein
LFEIVTFINSREIAATVYILEFFLSTQNTANE